MSLLSRLRNNPFVLPLVVVTALLMLAVNETSYWRSREALSTMNSVVTSRYMVQRLLGLIIDAETGQRGYLLTGRTEYLEPYRNALEAINSHQAQLKTLYEHEPRLQADLERMRPLIERRLSMFAEAIAMSETGDRQRALELEMTNLGKEQTDQIRAMAETMLSAETSRGARAFDGMLNTLQAARVGVAVMLVISFVVLVLYLRQALRLQAQQRAARAAIEDERNRLEREVMLRTKQLTELTRHLQSAREDERGKLSRELHDELGALLTAAKLDVARIKARVVAAAPDSAERLQHLAETLNSGIALKRRIIEDLRPSALSNLGLVTALENLLREFGERCPAQIRASLDPVSLSPSAELTVYRLVQESLTNIAKYANAKTIDISVSSRDDKVLVSVVDDGQGFEPQTTRTDAHGLLGMRYRVEGEGGSLSLASAPGRGTRVEATLPLHGPPPSDPA